MVFGQRNSIALRSKRTTNNDAPLSDLESPGEQDVAAEEEEDDKKYINHRTKRHTHTLTLFVFALGLATLFNRNQLKSSRSHLVSATNSIRKTDTYQSQRITNSKLFKQVNKYGFIVNKNKLPDDWEEWGFERIQRKFKCEKYVNEEFKPLPSMEYWQMVLDAYNKEVDSSYRFDPIVPPTEGYRFNEAGPPPYYAKLTKNKDRGVFASRDIQKGELVHDGTKSDVVFPNAMAWRRFVLALPRQAACDMTEWCWTQQLEKGGPMKIVMAINISSLMNTGSPNKINAMPRSSTSSLFYATQDIKKGQEILTDYDIYETRYDLVGLGE